MEEDRRGSKVLAIDTKTGSTPRKILEEEEYLGRMAWIIKRDFIHGPDTEASGSETDHHISERPDTTYSETPRTDRTDFSTTSSIRSMQGLRSMRLDEYLEKYTSEDNAYFDKLQRKELKRHRAKYPWLYSKKKMTDKEKIDSGVGRLAIEGPSRTTSETPAIEFKKNSLFYPPADIKPQSNKSIINYDSNKFSRDLQFKEPLPLRGARPRIINRFTDKIGVDGKLLNGDETPCIGGFSFVPPPDTPKLKDEPDKSVMEKNRYYIPSESPRDNLAHRLYEQKVAKKIRTPSSSSRSDSKKTPKSVLDKIF